MIHLAQCETLPLTTRKIKPCIYRRSLAIAATGSCLFPTHDPVFSHSWCIGRSRFMHSFSSLVLRLLLQLRNINDRLCEQRLHLVPGCPPQSYLALPTASFFIGIKVAMHSLGSCAVDDKLKHDITERASGAHDEHSPSPSALLLSSFAGGLFSVARRGRRQGND